MSGRVCRCGRTKQPQPLLCPAGCDDAPAIDPNRSADPSRAPASGPTGQNGEPAASAGEWENFILHYVPHVQYQQPDGSWNLERRRDMMRDIEALRASAGGGEPPTEEECLDPLVALYNAGYTAGAHEVWTDEEMQRHVALCRERLRGGPARAAGPPEPTLDEYENVKRLADLLQEVLDFKEHSRGYVESTAWYLHGHGVRASQGAGPRPDPKNTQHEPPYPGERTVVFSIRYPGLVAHQPTKRCTIAEPHSWDNCGEVRGPGPDPDEPIPALDRALAIAVQAHAGLADKQGEPYILHVCRVVQACPPGAARIVAALHDVVEDSDWTLEQLGAAGFGNLVVRAVDSITRRHGETYADYISRVAADEIARVVKVADLRDNLARADSLPEPHRDLVKRYEKALTRLAGGPPEGTT